MLLCFLNCRFRILCFLHCFSSFDAMFDLVKCQEALLIVKESKIFTYTFIYLSHGTLKPVRVKIKLSLLAKGAYLRHQTGQEQVRGHRGTRVSHFSFLL